MEKVKLQLGDSGDLRAELLLLLEKHMLFIADQSDSLHEKSGKPIHEIRRSFKKSRALLRLLRDSMDPAACIRENRMMGDMQRLLSRARDADVFLDLLSRLPDSYSFIREEAWYERALRRAKKHRDAECELLAGGLTPAIIHQGASLCMERFRQYELSANGFDLIEGGLRRIYRQGRALMDEAFLPDAEAEMVHLFRKRTKDLQYQLTFLKTIFPELLHATSKTLQKLTDTLGQYNDYRLAMEKFPGLVPGDAESQEKLGQLLDRLVSDMEGLKKEAGLLSRKLYAEETDQFIQRLAVYWEQYAGNIR